MPQIDQTITFAFIYILLVLTQGCDAVESCFSCVNVTDASACSRNTKVCQPQETCYSSLSLDELGVPRHSSGCISKQICNSFNSFSNSNTTHSIISGNVIGRRSSSACFRCCSNTSKTNRPCDRYSCHQPASTLSPTSQHQISNPLKIIYTDQPSHIMKGSEVHLACVVNGGNNPHITWIRPLGSLPIKSRTKNDQLTLVIPMFNDSDSGQYICVASDGQQFANHIFNLQIDGGHSSKPPTQILPTTTTSARTMPATTKSPGPPHITSIDVTPKIFHYGDNIVVTCHVTSYPKYNDIDWFMRGSALPTNVHAISVNNSAELQINNFQKINEGLYRCFVTNSLGDDHRDINLSAHH